MTLDICVASEDRTGRRTREVDSTRPRDGGGGRTGLRALSQMSTPASRRTFQSALQFTVLDALGLPDASSTSTLLSSPGPWGGGTRSAAPPPALVAGSRGSDPPETHPAELPHAAGAQSYLEDRQRWAKLACPEDSLLPGS